MAYKRVSKSQKQRHKNRAQKAVEKYQEEEYFLRKDPEHHEFNSKNREHFKKDKITPESNELDSYTSLYQEYRKKAPNEIDGEGLPHEAVTAFCNMQNFMNYFVRIDNCIEHNLDPTDVFLMLWLYQFEYVSVSFVVKSYHLHASKIYRSINKLSVADLLRGTRVRTNDKPEGVRSPRTVKLTEQANILCATFFREIKKDFASFLPLLERPNNVKTLLAENYNKKEVNPLYPKRRPKTEDKVYPPAVSKKVLKDLIRSNEWGNFISEKIFYNYYKRSSMEKFKGKEIRLELAALKKELEEEEEQQDD